MSNIERAIRELNSTEEGIRKWEPSRNLQGMLSAVPTIIGRVSWQNLAKYRVQ